MPRARRRRRARSHSSPQALARRAGRPRAGRRGRRASRAGSRTLAAISSYSARHAAPALDQLERPGRSAPPGTARCSPRSRCPGTRPPMSMWWAIEPGAADQRAAGVDGAEHLQVGRVRAAHVRVVGRASRRRGAHVVAPLRERRLQRELHQPELRRDLLGVRDHAARARRTAPQLKSSISRMIGENDERYSTTAISSAMRVEARWPGSPG